MKIPGRHLWRKCIAALLCLILITGCTLTACARESTETASYAAAVKKGEAYYDKEHITAYLVVYGTLPDNFITKKEAQALGWSSKSDLWAVAPGAAIGGDYFGNYENLLPEGEYRQCDVNASRGYRTQERIVYTVKGAMRVYYSPDNLKSFVQLYPADIETQYAMMVEEDGSYSDAEHITAYLVTYGRLPQNFITKRQAQALGWDSYRGNLWDVAPGCSIGGDSFGNYEGNLPYGTYRECDVDYTGGYRQSDRIVYTARGDLYIYLTRDHYNTFTQLYPPEDN